MVGQAGIAHVGEGGVTAQLFGDSGGVAALALYAQGHGLEAAVEEPGFVGAKVGAGLFEKVPKGGTQLVSGRNHAAQDIAMAANVLGGAVNNDVYAVGERTKEHGGGKGVVDEQECVVGAAQLGQAGDVDNFEKRIGDRFDDEDDGRLLGQHLGDGIEVGGIDEDAFYAVLGPETVDERIGGAVAILGGGDGSPGLDTAGGHGEVNGGHAAAGGKREVFAGAVGHVVAFQFDDGPFKVGHGGIAVAAVDVEIGVAAEGAVEVGGVIVDVADAGDDAADDGRGGDAIGGRGVAAGFAAMDGLADY